MSATAWDASGAVERRIRDDKNLQLLVALYCAANGVKPGDLWELLVIAAYAGSTSTLNRLSERRAVEARQAEIRG